MWASYSKLPKIFGRLCCNLQLQIQARQVFITGSKSGLFNINEVGLKNLKSQKKTEQNIEENDTINHFQL